MPVTKTCSACPPSVGMLSLLYQGLFKCMHFVSILVKYVCTLLRACVQLTACRVVTESKTNCILYVLILSNLIITEQLHESIGTGHY